MSEVINYINAGPNGTFKPSGKLKTVPEQVDVLIDHIISNDVKKLVIHFHGGLVKESSGKEVAGMMAKVLGQAGALPLTFIWETGVFETLKDNFSTIHKTKLFKYLVRTLLKVIAKRLGIEIPGARGVNDLSEEDINSELEKEDPFSDFMANAKSADEVEVGFDENDLRTQIQLELEEIIDNDEVSGELQPIDPDEVKFLEEDPNVFEDIDKGARGFISVGLAIKLTKISICVIKRYFKKRFHGIYPTIIEEVIRVFYVGHLGAWVWKGMKEKAEKMWNSNEGRSGEDLYAGRYFLDKLATLQKIKPGLELSLIGHSAGSVAICHLMKSNETLAHPIKIKNIFFLAPACTVKLFHDEIFSRQNRFDNFRMFTMSDQYEVRDKMIPYVYTRSLLYLVSGAFEIPGKCTNESILGLERNLRGRDPYNTAYERAVSNYLATNDRMINSVTNPDSADGRKTESEKHGDFDNDITTQSSLIHLIKNN